MKKFFVMLLIAAFMLIAFILNRQIQKLVKPRQSFTRLMIYFLVILILVFLLSFLMVLFIGRLYPDELIK